jgi:hypothetical protein
MIDRVFHRETNEMLRLLLEGKGKLCRTPNCGRVFRIDPEHPNKVVCDRYCYRQKHNKQFGHCAFCGTEFLIGQRKRFCSAECIKDYRAETSHKIVQCAYCDTSFVKTKYRHKYCSPRCSSIGLKMAPSNRSYNPLEERTCQSPECNKTFKTTDSRKIFCSPRCGRIAARRRSTSFPQTRKCSACNNEFQINSRQTPKVYCSTKCKNNHAKKCAPKRTCQYCKDPYSSLDPTARFCSPRCAINDRNLQARLMKESRKRRCQNPQCNKEFVPKKLGRKFCSRMCSDSVVLFRSRRLETASV